jgi:hypothetical protein
MRGALVALALVAGACARDGGRRSIDHRGAAAAPLDAGAADAADSPCVTACVRDRQMVAMSAEAIALACRRDCAGAP